MKQVFLVGVLTAALGAGAAAQGAKSQPPPPPPAKPAEAPKTEAKAPARQTRRAPSAADQGQGHTTPKPQPTTEAPGAAPTGELQLGSVHLTKAVKADGKPLAAGTYQLRLTAQEATPNVPGQTEQLERWVEFMQRGQVKGREVVTIVPQSEIDKVQKDAPPRPNGSKVEMLKGGDYYRVWINKAGNHFLIHLPPA